MKLREVKRNKDLAHVNDRCIVCGAIMVRSFLTISFFCSMASFRQAAHYTVEFDYDQSHGLYIYEEVYIIKDSIIVSVRSNHTMICSDDRETTELDFPIAYNEHFEETVLNNLILS